MIIGKVVGSAVSTVKDERLRGYKFLIMQPLNGLGQLEDQIITGVSEINAGQGDYVLIVEGSQAQNALNQPLPVDCVVIGILDRIEIKGKEVADMS